MRAVLLPALLAIALPTILPDSGCGKSENATITDIRFPDLLVGDGLYVPGELDFVDPDAGARYLYLYVWNCPLGSGNCPTGFIDLTEWDPEVTTYTEATVPFSMMCDNPTATDFYFDYTWYIYQEDQETSGNGYKMSFVCQGTSLESLPPTITANAPPLEVVAGEEARGELTFADENGGITWLHARPIVCPDGVVCENETVNLASYGQSVQSYTAGTVFYDIGCENATQADSLYALGLTLEDSQGNLSNEVEFTFVCKPSAGVSPSGTEPGRRLMEASAAPASQDERPGAVGAKKALSVELNPEWHGSAH